MGRPRWTTPEQLAFLESFLHLLPQVKGSTGLTTLYSQVYDAFLQKWDPAPLKPDPKLSPEALEAAVKTRLHSRIAYWYGCERQAAMKGLPYSKPAPRVLDLSGKSRHKKSPYQPHQAFSILHWQPAGSSLHGEVEDLWAQQLEPSVHQMLKPFLSETAKSSSTTSEKLLFHMAVMHWKCSLLSPDERTELNSWINHQKIQRRQLEPFHGQWKLANMETIYSLRTLISIDNLATTVQTAIEEIERQTGWKAMVILGGLKPGAGGITSHLYETGKSRNTEQLFREAHPEVVTVCTMFHEWLRTVYSDEEKKQCSLQGAISLLSMASPPLLDLTAMGTKDASFSLHLADTCQGHSTPTTTSALSRLRRVVRGHYKSGRNPKEKPNLNRTSFGLTDKGLSLQQD
ncbi:hypothetical protein BJ322DRAFT_1112500 [Thelephora terrestris]|uniref:Uncharacterized protein n=1 Tax=Thelephora terrestris TaxID=56493 RepID=A0A9P6H6F1_9AGAM|nr:hypothetical protein BJ322DRAFT_1112500 [Thelephora terrestris]